MSTSDVLRPLAVVVGAVTFSVNAAVSVVTNDTVVSVNGSGELNEAFLAPFVTSVVFASTPMIQYYPSAPSTYAGGTEVANGQLYVGRDDALGSGPISLGTEGDAALMVRDREVTVPNRVDFVRSGAYAVGFGDAIGSLTLKSIGTGGSTYHTVRLGRNAAGNVGRVTLSLTEEDSEPISQFMLQGALKLTLDGGTIKARSDAKAPFFNLSTSDPADITVTAAGVTFESPEGTTLRPGQPLKFQSLTTTNAVEACQPQNPGFEDGKTANWTFTTLPGGESDSAVKVTPNAWDGNGAYPPIGTKFAMIRQGVRLSTTVDVPASGLWRVVFYRGGRPSYSTDIALDVALDETITHFPASSVLPFTKCMTQPVEIEAGSHTISFATSNGGSGHSLNIDEVSLERVEVVTTYGALSKTGDGTLALVGQDLMHVLVSVLEGELDLADANLAGTAVSVASGAGLLLRSATTTEATTVNVPAGARLTLSGFDDSVVANGSFEADGPYDYANQMHPRGWSFRKDGANDGWGLQKNGGTLSGSGPMTPAGVCTVYLRENETIYQTCTLDAAGTYRLSFLAADRKYASSQKVPFAVRVDGIEVLAVGAREAYADFTCYSLDVELGAGSHELSLSTGIVGSGVQGNIVFFDDVSLRRIRTDSITVDGELRLHAGSVLALDFQGVATVPHVFVDDVPVNGGKGALLRAGVSVHGTGRIAAGEKQGLIMIVR